MPLFDRFQHPFILSLSKSDPMPSNLSEVLNASLIEALGLVNDDIV